MNWLATAWAQVAPHTGMIALSAATMSGYAMLARRGTVFPFAPCSLVENRHGYQGYNITWARRPHVAWVIVDPADYQNKCRDLLHGFVMWDAVEDELYTLKVWPSWVSFARNRLFGWSQSTQPIYHVTMRRVNNIEVEEKVVEATLPK